MRGLTSATWLATIIAGLVVAGCAVVPAMPGPFYQGEAPSGARPGEVLRLEAMAGAPAGAAAQRMLYVSRGLDGAPIAVSAVVVAPSGAAPPSGRNVVAVKKCASST